MLSQRGKFISHGCRLEPHELATVEYYVARGHKIELIVPSSTSRVSNADLVMDDGLAWEMKSPCVSKNKTLQTAFKKAVSQAPNVIFDLRRLRRAMPAAQQLQFLFSRSRRVKNMRIIMKDQTERIFVK
ncbi:hypothetical protein IJJ12_00510 [bacterium]|nr:hypothetical protein [bacterium]